MAPRGDGSSPTPNPLESYLEEARSELEQVRVQLKEVSLLVEQSQGEVEKLAQRNAAITGRLHQLQAHFDTVPREDIRAAYEAAQDAQQRLFTMRGQLEKLQSDQANLSRYAEFLVRTLQLLEGSPDVEVGASGVTAGGLSLEQIIGAQEQERQRLSRAIHDGPAQALANFILQAEIALRLFETDRERARQELSNLKSAASSTFSQVRDFIFDLRPMMLDDLGLVPTVRRYTEALREKTGLDLNLVITGKERRLEPHIEVLVFRTIQDLLANIRDHAQATQARVLLDMDEHQVRVTVEDNGKGFNTQILEQDGEQGRGLRSLRDRVRQAAGDLEVDSAEGKGSQFIFAIPTAA